MSWYEAAAYAAFAGRSLPTIHHWYAAAGRERFADMLAASNFSEKGPARVGEYPGLGPFGTYDMAGNLKEWCSTASADQRFLLGGAWNEPRYTFGDLDARGPFERAASYGFRLVKYERPPPAEVTAAVRLDALVDARFDGRTLTPVSDAIFAVYRAEYAYDPAPLHTVVEATETTGAVVKQTIVFDTAYGERMRAYLFLPGQASPPYQTVVFFPGGDAFRLTSSRDLSQLWMKPILDSGRAFLYPVYKGTYERQTPGPTGPNGARDLSIAWFRDFARALDYLETRPDIDASRLAFYGVSDGANAGVVLTALDPRIKVAVLQGAGLDPDQPPDADALNFAPRVRVPTLMVNGRYDFEDPYETSQRPLFLLLGSPAGQKQHATFETGHAVSSDIATGVILPWLDRYLGSVVRPPGYRDECSQGGLPRNTLRQESHPPALELVDAAHQLHLPLHVTGLRLRCFQQLMHRPADVGLHRRAPLARPCPGRAADRGDPEGCSRAAARCARASARRAWRPAPRRSRRSRRDRARRTAACAGARPRTAASPAPRATRCCPRPGR